MKFPLGPSATSGCSHFHEEKQPALLTIKRNLLALARRTYREDPAVHWQVNWVRLDG